MAYTLTLFLHSYLRYLVLVAGLVTLARGVRGWQSKLPFTDGDKRSQVAFLAVLDLQLVLGLVLYGALSPITQAFFDNPKAGMKDHMVRFFGVEHIFAMIIAITIAHVGRVRSKKAPTDELKHKRMAIPMIIWLVITLASIPWPGLPYGRALFR